LVDARGSWVSLPQILALGIAQFGARILELRRTGFAIENKIERDYASVVHSWYRLVNSQTLPAAPSPPKPEPAKPKASLPNSDDWYERQHGPQPAAKPLPDHLPLFAGVGE
jgi:hypothetical protein